MKILKDINQRIKRAPKYEVDMSFGLSSEQVKERRKAKLTNIQKKQVTKSYGRIVFDNLVNPLNILLLAIFAMMLFGDLPGTSYLFMVILAANCLIGLIQDFNARRLVDKLKVVSETKVKVIRNGKTVEVSSDGLVLSDVVSLSLGDQVPSDCVLLDGLCGVNESMLTGESKSVNKVAGDEILRGSYLTSGHCLAQIVKVGRANYAATLQGKAAKFRKPQSEIKKAINKVILIAASLVLAFGIAATIVWGTKLDLGIKENYTTYVRSLSGSLVSMVPTGMYLLTSLTLAVGVILLAKRRMLVQELYCIEMLARVDMLCLDKTGTLTDTTMTVDAVIPFGSHTEEEVRVAVSSLEQSTNDSNQTAEALRGLSAKTYGISSENIIPFDSKDKFSAASFKGIGTIAVGAYGFLNIVANPKAKETVDEWSRKGYRVICVYENKRMIKDGKMPLLNEVIGAVVISNHIKEDAKENIEWFQNNGVEVRVISGDNPATVATIAAKVGAKDADKYLDCESLSDRDLKRICRKYCVFGRVSPEQKEILISEFKKQGHTVAMTGDGVNDILALKVADCSIAMASGSDAAKSAAHIVSLDNGFSKLPDVVDQGRRVINNLQRTCSLFLSKTVFAVILSAVFLVAQACGGMNYPFVTNHMMMWEMVTIGFASFFLALQPSHEKLEGSFIKNVLSKATAAGLAETIVALLGVLTVNSLGNQVIDLSVTSLNDGMILMSVLAFTAVSLVVLFKVCLPMDLYRRLVFVGVCLCCGGLIAIDVLYPSLNLLGLNWAGLKPMFFVVLIGIVAISSGVFCWPI